MLPEKDRVRLEHMREAVLQALEFVAGRSRDDLDSDRMLLFALVRSLEIVGEAASQVTPESRAACPGIPWKAVVGMRNRLIHAYFEVDRDSVWEVLRDDLGPLLQVLDTILSDEPDAS